MAIVSIDSAIVNVALAASIQHDLGLDHAALQWVVVAYGLLLGGFLLLGGRMADQLGRRRVFLTGLVVFTGASLLAGITHGGGLLIVARAVQGVGAALIVPAALSLLAVRFPEGPERDRAVGLFGAVGGLSATVETYWTRRRGVEAMDYSYALMDLTVCGRQEPWEDSPTGWPRHCSMRTDGGSPTWPPVSEERGGRPIAQWERLEAGHSDDLTGGRP